MFFTKGCFVFIIIIIESLFITTNGAILGQVVFNDRQEQEICSDRLKWNSNAITLVGDGTFGVASNQLDGPRGVFFHQKTRILYIADRSNHRIQQLLPNGQIKTVAGDPNGQSGTENNRLDMPSAIFVDENENLFIVDSNNHRVQKWAKDATSGTTVAGQTGNPGSGLNQLSRPQTVWVDSKGSLYIADYDNHRIIRRTSDSSVVVAGGNGAGHAPNQLNGPIGLYFDEPRNDLIIASYLSSFITKWKIGDTQGIIFAGIPGQNGSSSTELFAPSTVALDTNFHIYVADTYNHRIQLFCNDSSKEGKTIAGITGQWGNSSNQLKFPHDFALDIETLDLFVSDGDNNRVQKFSFISPSSNGIAIKMVHHLVLALILMIGFILYE